MLKLPKKWRTSSGYFQKETFNEEENVFINIFPENNWWKDCIISYDEDIPQAWWCDL